MTLVVRVLFLLAVVAALLLTASGHRWLSFWAVVLAGVLGLLPVAVAGWRTFHHSEPPEDEH